VLINQRARIESTLFATLIWLLLAVVVRQFFILFRIFVATAVRDCRALAQRPQKSRGSTLRKARNMRRHRRTQQEIGNRRTKRTTRPHSSASRSKLKIGSG